MSSRASVIDLSDRGRLEEPIERGAPLLVYQEEQNRSLWLAQAEHFDLICKDLLWPGEDEEMFGEMLRGLVVALRPQSRWHLELLRNVASCQWQLYRLSKIQRNLVGQQPGNGRHGLPNGTINALEYEQGHSRALSDLQKALQIYKMMNRKTASAQSS